MNTLASLFGNSRVCKDTMFVETTVSLKDCRCYGHVEGRITFTDGSVRVELVCKRYYQYTGSSKYHTRTDSYTTLGYNRLNRTFKDVDTAREAVSKFLDKIRTY